MRAWCVCTFAALAAALSAVRPAAAQSLTFEEALERARTRAPEVLVAFSRVEEARARLLGASVRFRENPALDVEAGPRNGPAGRTWDYSAGVGQRFETGGQRGARIAAAQADIDQAAASADETARVVTREVAIAFLRALAADERRRLLTAAESVAEQLREATERRYQAGDVAAIDLNLTRIAAARARADRIGVDAERTDALRPLRAALGFSADAPIALAGSLDRTPAPRPVLLAALDRLPAVREVTAEMARAQADIRLGAALRRPDLGARLMFAREEDAHLVIGGLSITLPAFDRAQGLGAEADARLRRATAQREALRRALEVDVAAGLDAYEQRHAAADLLRDSAIPAADDNESLGARSLEAGEINLMAFLLVRQDVTAARLSYVDARLEAAVAAVEAEARAGALR